MDVMDDSEHELSSVLQRLDRQSREMGLLLGEETDTNTNTNITTTTTTGKSSGHTRSPRDVNILDNSTRRQLVVNMERLKNRLANMPSENELVMVPERDPSSPSCAPVPAIISTRSSISLISEPCGDSPCCEPDDEEAEYLSTQTSSALHEPIGDHDVLVEWNGATVDDMLVADVRQETEDMMHLKMEEYKQEISTFVHNIVNKYKDDIELLGDTVPTTTLWQLLIAQINTAIEVKLTNLQRGLHGGDEGEDILSSEANSTSTHMDQTARILPNPLDVNKRLQQRIVDIGSELINGLDREALEKMMERLQVSNRLDSLVSSLQDELKQLSALKLVQALEAVPSS